MVSGVDPQRWTRRLLTDGRLHRRDPETGGPLCREPLRDEAHVLDDKPARRLLSTGQASVCRPCELAVLNALTRADQRSRRSGRSLRAVFGGLPSLGRRR